MAHLRGPDWDQGADRHSDLVDPVLTVRQLSRFDHRRGYSRIDNALVFTTDKGAFDVYFPPRRPARSLLATKRYTAVYEVDMGVHNCTASLLLPSENDAFDFTAEVELTWQVTRPQRFVEQNEGRGSQNQKGKRLGGRWGGTDNVGRCRPC